MPQAARPTASVTPPAHSASFAARPTMPIERVSLPSRASSPRRGARPRSHTWNLNAAIVTLPIRTSVMLKSVDPSDRFTRPEWPTLRFGFVFGLFVNRYSARSADGVVRGRSRGGKGGAHTPLGIRGEDG